MTSTLTLVLFPGVSKGPSMPLEPEPDVDRAPSPPTDPPGSPLPVESDNPKPKSSKRKTKVEEWSHSVDSMLFDVHINRPISCYGANS